MVVITWEISRTGFKRFRQADRWKAICSAFCQPKEGAGSVCSWLWGWQYSGWCPMHNTPSRPVFYPSAGRSAIDGNPGRWFVFLLGAAPCHCARPGNSADGQGIWHLFSTYPAPWARVLLWSDSGLGLAGGLQLLFPQGGQQSYQQPAKENKGSAGCAGLCEKRLRYRL